MGEVIFGVTLIAALVGWTGFLPWKSKGQLYWFITMMACTLAVVAMEIFSKITTDITISRHYWNWSLEHEGLSWLVALLMIAGWLNLIVHLQWKVIKRRFFKKEN